MTKRILTPVFLLTTLACHAQGFVSGGYLYNLREDNHGFLLEAGYAHPFLHHSTDLSVGFFKMTSDPYKFREVQLMSRFWLDRNFAIEGGWGMGAVCFTPQDPAACQFHGTTRTRTPVIGVEWAGNGLWHNLLWHSRPVVRLDFTRWQLPPTHGQDDGFRMMIGIRWSGHISSTE